METAARVKARSPRRLRRWTIDQKAEVIRAHERMQCSQSELGRRLGLAQSMVSCILRNKEAILAEQANGGEGRALVVLKL